jgi:hypothetical protein
MASNTWYVDGVSGSDSNTCISPTIACKTIGHAISLAASGQSILVAAATYAEHLTIDTSITIVGSGATTTIIDGKGGFGRVVTISNTSAHVILSNLTIRNGSTTNAAGGGVYNVGTLTINSSTISGNVAAAYCRSPYPCGTDGGGIFNGGTLTLNNDTISGNTVSVSGCVIVGDFCSATGGGIASTGGTLTINSSTISGNVAVQHSLEPPRYYSLIGGIFTDSSTMINKSTISGNSPDGIVLGGTLTQMINNSTISGNSRFGIDNFGGMLTLNNDTISRNIGNGIINSTTISVHGTITLQNSIVADNSSANCIGSMTSKGYNRSSDGTCNLSGPGDLNNHDPLLGPLQNNGGPTHTMALLSGSPAIDSGNPNGCTDGNGHLLTTDQRGMPRPDKEDIGRCDIGAYERQSD